MQKKLFGSILIMMASTFALSAVAETNNTSTGSSTPTSPPPMSQQQFKTEVDKAVKESAEDLNSRVQQLQKSGPGSLIQPEPMRDPNAVDDQNAASIQTQKPAAPVVAPAPVKPTAPKAAPAAPSAPEQTESVPAASNPAPYTGYGTGKTNDSNSGNNNNSKSNSWNMGY